MVIRVKLTFSTEQKNPPPRCPYEKAMAEEEISGKEMIT